MKNRIQFTSKTLICIIILLITLNSAAQNVGINETGAMPHNSALLDLDADNKGFLITRADTANINNPAFGLMTLSPIDSCLYIYSGDAWLSQGGVGYDCSCSNGGSNGGAPPSFPCNGTVIPVIDVTNPTTGQTWMDRNLGADQVAISSTDADAYGDVYQWGRCSDGHEDRNSTIITTQSSSDTPGHGDYIGTSASTTPKDWRNPQNDNLWQGASGINNPCPTGYRLPTEAELEAEHLSWNSQDAAGAYASSLKLPVSGGRTNTGDPNGIGVVGLYWSSTISGDISRALFFMNGTANISNSSRSGGCTVRCIKD